VRTRGCAPAVGAPPTYPTDRGIPPVVAIDHVLVADRTALEVDTVDLPGSDHRAVVARILLEAN